MELPATASFVVCSDLHCTDRPQDSYRFGIFSWLKDILADHQIDDLIILGDLTNSKDRHPASLVNRLLEELVKIPVRITILKGNHDYVDEDTPFFKFMNYIPHVTFVNIPRFKKRVGGVRSFWLPHNGNRHLEQDLKSIVSENEVEVMFMHETVHQAVVNDRSLVGYRSANFYSQLGIPILSGDVHQAQVLGNVEYVGAPYAIDFGDVVTRSCIVFDADERYEYLFPAPQKKQAVISTAEDLDKLELGSGDLVRVQIIVDPNGIDTVSELRSKLIQLANEKNLVLDGIEMTLTITNDSGALPEGVFQVDENTFYEFCKAHNLDTTVAQYGYKLLDSVRRRRT